MVNYGLAPVDDKQKKRHQKYEKENQKERLKAHLKETSFNCRKRYSKARGGKLGTLSFIIRRHVDALAFVWYRGAQISKA